MVKKPLKSDVALRTIGEVSEILGLPAHVIRFWEVSFVKLKPVKYNNRRYYTAQNIELIKTIKDLLYVQGYSINDAVQCINLPVDKRASIDLQETLNKLLKARQRLSSLLK
jgi:DNA-binding transcriptional MerR regulator